MKLEVWGEDLLLRNRPDERRLAQTPPGKTAF